MKPPLVIHPNMTLIDLLREFRQGKSHMAFITEQRRSRRGGEVVRPRPSAATDCEVKTFSLTIYEVTAEMQSRLCPEPDGSVRSPNAWHVQT